MQILISQKRIIQVIQLSQNKQRLILSQGTKLKVIHRYPKANDAKDPVALFVVLHIGFI